MELLYYSETGGIGGAENYLMWLANYFNASMDIAVCTPNNSKIELMIDFFKKKDIQCLRINTKWYSSRIKLIVSLFIVFLKNKPRLIHFSRIGTTSCLGAIIAATLLRIPFIVTEHFIPMNTVFSWKYKLYRYFLGKCAYKFIAPSQTPGRKLIDFHKVPEEKIEFIYNGVELPRDFENTFNRERYCVELNIKENEVVFIIVACLEPHKNQMLAIQAFSKLLENNEIEAKLLIVGEGSIRRELLEKIQELGLKEKCLLLGYREDVACLLKISDVFILTSIEENFSLAALEAGLMGLPLVLSHVGGLPEMIKQDETGYLFDPENVSELVEYMSLLLNKSLREKLGNAGKLRISNLFSFDKMILKTK